MNEVLATGSFKVKEWLCSMVRLSSAVTIKATIALQNICKAQQFDWDDPLPDEMS